MKKEKKENRLPLIPVDTIDPLNSIGAGLLGIAPLGIDPLGSYTGVTEDPQEIPVQDADDL